MLRKHLRRASAVVLSLFVLLICFGRGAHSQTFSSGSTGADGPLNLTTPGTITDLKSVNPAFDPEGDNVYHFTTINIGSGVTVRLTTKNTTGPVYWLAQGAVTINGTVDLSGDNGHPESFDKSSRVPAAGGAGGYSGGVGGISLNPNLPAAQPGNGPGGGAAAAAPTPSSNAKGGNGSFTGSQYLIPLIGGSGGGGGSEGTTTQNYFGGGGGGGGGAILIASSVSITYGGTIRANGGAAGSPAATVAGGAGSGGAIRLIAPTISDQAAGDSPCRPFGSLHGSLQVATGGAVNGFGVGVGGIIRLEAFDLSRADLADCEPNALTSTPFNVIAPITGPSLLKVTSLVVSGTTIPINANPFTFPDATINSSTPVTVNVQAQFIPTGTVPKIIVMSETGPDQTVNCSSGLQGTLQQSTCSAPITFPTGGSRGFVKATWTQ